MDDARRQSLDEFFAQAEDVLTDWAGSPDAMNSAPNACLDFAGALRPPSATEALTLFRVTWADEVALARFLARQPGAQQAPFREPGADRPVTAADITVRPIEGPTMPGPTVEELAVAWRERYLAEQRLMANVIQPARNWLMITAI